MAGGVLPAVYEDCVVAAEVLPEVYEDCVAAAGCSPLLLAL
ncbi:MAG: hypothetical protein R2867_21560 [Caldilineaceae bacterium]